MGFWKRNKEKIVADTVSGVFIRVAIGGLLLFLGIWVAPKFVTLPVDNVIAKELIDLARRVVLYVYFIIIFFMRDILNWLSQRRQDRNTELELKNENLQLENENLKLKLELQEKQSQPDNDE